MKRLLLILIMGFSFFGLFGQNNNFKIVDAHEFDKFLEDTYTKIATETLPKDKPVALYCRSGNRSKTAARILADKGYEVVELGTGFRGWVAAGKDVMKSK